MVQMGAVELYQMGGARSQNQLLLYTGAGLRVESRQVGVASVGGFNKGSLTGISEKSQGRGWGCAAAGREGEQQRIC